MAYTRTSAASWLAVRLAMPAAEAKQTDLTDSTAGFGYALDAALRALGATEATLATATVIDTDVPAFLALAEYHALARIWRTLSIRADPANVRGVNSPRAQVFQHVKDLLAQVAAECAALGYPVGGVATGGSGGGAASTGSWSVGSLTLDFIEPIDESS